jgi:glutaminyl-peptide cyclotransferase
VPRLTVDGILLLGAVLVSFGLGCQPAQAAERTTPTVIETHPHDADAFTQGLLLHDGVFYESTGLYGESTLREVEPETGRVLRSTALGADEFGEGLALVDDRLIQLTWKKGVAYEYRRDDFELLRSFEYEGEGWGLCYDGSRLVMSDGSSRLTFRDASSFEVLGSVEVEIGGAPVDQLNELECVGDRVFSNVWQTDWILEIDPTSGEVLTQIDASGLLTSSEANAADVLNGIAYDPDTRHFFITGKLWPKLFEVRFGAQGADDMVEVPDAGQGENGVSDAGADVDVGLSAEDAGSLREATDSGLARPTTSAGLPASGDAGAPVALDATDAGAIEAPVRTTGSGSTSARPDESSSVQDRSPDASASGGVSEPTADSDAGAMGAPATGSSDGCGCAVGRRESSGALAWLVWVLALAMGRRRHFFCLSHLMTSRSTSRHV